MTKTKTKEEKQAYLQELFADCDERWNFLKQGLPPGTGMNTVELRLNTFIIHLVEWGIITEDQKLDFEIKFAETIQDQLIDMKKDYDQQMKDAKKKVAPKLVIPSAAETQRLGKLGAK